VKINIASECIDFRWEHH